MDIFSLQVGDSFLLVPVGFREGNMKIHILIKKELNKKLDEGPSKKREGVDEQPSESDEESNEESSDSSFDSSSDTSSGSEGHSSLLFHFF